MEDKKENIITEDNVRVHSSYLEPLVKKTYTMKALQNSKQMEVLTWDSRGDFVNYNNDGTVTTDQWDRYGICLGSSPLFSGNGNGMGYFLTDYDGFYDLPVSGNRSFKAAMCKFEHDIMLPPYSSYKTELDMYMTFIKISESSQANAWAGLAVMSCDHCKTVSESNHQSSDWTGIPESELYYSEVINQAWYESNSRLLKEMKKEASNDESDKPLRFSLEPIYLMAMAERPTTYDHIFGILDKYPYFKVKMKNHFTAYLYYSGMSGHDTADFDEESGTKCELRTLVRSGYKMKGWLDGSTNVLYPAGGAYRQRGGARLTDQWVEDVVPYTVVHYHADGMGKYSRRSETFYYMTGGMVCPQPEQDVAYKTPEPITACVAADGSTLIEYYYEIMEYPVQYCANGGKFEDGTDYIEQSLSCGEKIPANDLSAYRQGYSFEKWEPQLPQEMPCSAVTTRIVWTANNYTINFDGNDKNATGEMEPQGFVYDQPQQLSKNKYECRHTVSFVVGDRRGDKAYFQPQTAECHFMGWAETADGEKVYDDGATVCNLTSERDGVKTLYAVWKSASILLPQLQVYHEGFYFDAWYLDEACMQKAGEPGSMYILTQSETLYGKVVCRGVENTKWVPGNEDIDKRTIAAEWDGMKEATAYRVGLESAEDGADKKSYPFCEEDFTGNDVKLNDDGTVEVKGCRLDLTNTLKRFTAGGSFKFSVVPIIPNFPQDNILGNSDNMITTLARPKNPNWDETRTVAMWDSVEGADYYLMWLYSGGVDIFSATGSTASELCHLEQYNDVNNCVIVLEEKVDLSGAINEAGNAEYEVVGYSKNIEKYYTPLYERARSETN